MRGQSSKDATTPGSRWDDVLDQRTLNRALLARQMLLRREKMPAATAIEHLVGMQAQVPNAPYIGLWTRLEDFRPDELSDLIKNRGAVRLALQRDTIHLVTARDCLTLRPLLQPMLERRLYTGTPFGRNIMDMDIDALMRTGRALLEEKPRTMSQLGKLLHAQWPERDATSMAYAIRNLLPLVQVPPRGVWGASGQTILTTAEAWLNHPLEANPPPDKLVMRYLAAFGPASVMDVQAWSGLTRLRETLERLRPDLLTFHDERGVELFDLPAAPRPAPDTPAPPRFLPEYDNILLGHADRSRIMDNEHRNALFTGAVLVDGFGRGIWKIIRSGASATLVIQPFATLSKPDRDALAEEGSRLLDFAAADATTYNVQFASP